MASHHGGPTRAWPAVGLVALAVSAGACGGEPGVQSAGRSDGADSGADTDNDNDDTADLPETLSIGHGPRVAPPGYVVCGIAGVCPIATHVCCYASEGTTTGTASCVKGSKCRGAQDAVVRCEKGRDCPTAKVCCGSVASNGNPSASCETACSGQFQRCDSPGDCAAEKACSSNTCHGYATWTCGSVKPLCDW